MSSALPIPYLLTDTLSTVTPMWSHVAMFCYASQQNQPINTPVTVPPCAFSAPRPAAGLESPLVAAGPAAFSFGPACAPGACRDCPALAPAPCGSQIVTLAPWKGLSRCCPGYTRSRCCPARQKSNSRDLDHPKVLNAAQAGTPSSRWTNGGGWGHTWSLPGLGSD